MNNIYWVVQRRTRFFGTWKPVFLFATEREAREYESFILGGGPNHKVDRVELIEYQNTYQPYSEL